MQKGTPRSVSFLFWSYTSVYHMPLDLDWIPVVIITDISWLDVAFMPTRIKDIRLPLSFAYDAFWEKEKALMLSKVHTSSNGWFPDLIPRIWLLSFWVILTEGDFPRTLLFLNNVESGFPKPWNMGSDASWFRGVVSTLPFDRTVR